MLIQPHHAAAREESGVRKKERARESAQRGMRGERDGEESEESRDGKEMLKGGSQRWIQKEGKTEPLAVWRTQWVKCSLHWWEDLTLDL